MQAVSCIVTSSDGCHLYAEAAGNRDNPALLFIHGVSVSSAWWRKQFDRLSDQFYCVRFDLRGHGASEKPAKAAAYQESKRWADDVAAIVTTFELSKPAVCVWSYGGLVLADYLRYYGQANLSGLVLVDTTSQLNTDQGRDFIHQGSWEQLNKLFSNDVTTYREGVEACCKGLTLHPIERQDGADFLGAAYLTAPSTWQAMLTRQVDNTDVFQALPLPTLVVYGQQDKIFTPLAAEQLVKTIPNAQISYYPCGHAPFYEYAERFNMELVQFLNAPLAK